jgi:prepilin-type N-terminal cleavage/methylation domain-containing protein
MKKLQKGFTLIELLVVIAIIGILSAVVITNIAPTRDNARRAAVRANLDGVLPDFLNTCLSGAAITVPVMAGYTFVLNGQNCVGAAADGTFNVGVTVTPVTGCSATIRNTGITYTGC